MVKVSKKIAEKNAADLVKATGETIRENGIAAASVVQIAARVGLTHGAVYRHYVSKDDLAAVAITADFASVTTGLEAMHERGASLRQYFAGYLDPDHRDYFQRGCPVAPLSAEISRAEPKVQLAFLAGLNANIAGIARLSGIADPAAATAYASFALATLSGAMAMARATRPVDAAVSDRILAATLDGLLTDPRLPKAGPPTDV
jgi:TetR/AcrR family transcriptional regulator, transcriptional repressor for nem operon